MLAPDGMLILSIAHPCFFLPSSLNYFEKKRKPVIIKKYRSSKKFIKHFGNNNKLLHFHHTLTTYFSTFLKYNFKLLSFKEIFSNKKIRSILKYHFAYL